MNKLFKHNLYTLTAAVILGAFSLSFSPAATAIAMYDANASLSLTLNSVKDSTGFDVSSDWWDVKVDELPDLNHISEEVIDDAQASGVVVPAAQSMNIAEALIQTSLAIGSATDGISITEILTDLTLTLSNFTNSSLEFSFDYVITAKAETEGEEAYAEAEVLIYDDDDLYFDAYADAESLSPTIDEDSQEFSDSFIFTLLAYDETNGCNGYLSGYGPGPGCSSEVGFLYAEIDAYGEAAAYADVPEPAVIWLLGIGLLGLLGAARSRQSV